MSKIIKVSINKIIIKQQKSIICNYINLFNKINMYTYLQIFLRAANYLIYFKNYIIGY